MHFRYFDLPHIPDHLLLTTPEEFSTLTNIFKFPNYPYFKQYAVSTELNDFMKQHVSFPFYCSWQVVRNNIAIHKDNGRTEAVNYIIDTGGINAQLNIFDDDAKTIVFSEKIPPRIWHWIDVGRFHNVTGIESVRIAVSLSVLNGSLK
jgi:hypothetical protein